MNLKEVSRLIHELENEKVKDMELIDFYKEKRRKLIKEIVSNIKKQVEKI